MHINHAAKYIVFSSFSVDKMNRFGSVINVHTHKEYLESTPDGIQRVIGDMGNSFWPQLLTRIVKVPPNTCTYLSPHRRQCIMLKGFFTKGTPVVNITVPQLFSLL